MYASSRNLYARSLKIRKINYILTWISYIFDVLKFDLGVNNFRCNLNKVFSIASLWTHCWKDTILTSSSDIYCNFYRLCPWLIIKPGRNTGLSTTIGPRRDKTFDKTRFKPVSSATETSQKILILLLASLDNWASSRENLSSGFPTKRFSNQSPQLQRLARK